MSSEWTSDWLKGTSSQSTSRRIELGLSDGHEDLLFHRRISTRYPTAPIGQDLSFHCIADDGGVYFCKDDRDGRPIRATEWIATALARHVGIAVADAAILEGDYGATFFGSKSPACVAADIELNNLLSQPAVGEIGQPLPWLGRHLAGLYAFDLFINNPDRTNRNFILDQDGGLRRLRAIDFASAAFLTAAPTSFPVATDATVRVRTLACRTHGAHRDSAIEMVDRIGATPWQVVDEIVARMPEDWLTDARKRDLRVSWKDGRQLDRLSRLREQLEHEP